MLSADQLAMAKRLRLGDRSYEAISTATGATVHEIKDALIPGWREQGCRHGRHAAKEARPE